MLGHGFDIRAGWRRRGKVAFIALRGGPHAPQRVDTTELSDHDFYMINTPNDPG